MYSVYPYSAIKINSKSKWLTFKWSIYRIWMAFEYKIKIVDDATQTGPFGGPRGLGGLGGLRGREEHQKLGRSVYRWRGRVLGHSSAAATSSEKRDHYLNVRRNEPQGKNANSERRFELAAPTTAPHGPHCPTALVVEFTVNALDVSYGVLFLMLIMFINI